MTAPASDTARPLIRHLYVHIPFCTHICPYCSFYKTRNSLPQIQEFIPALKAEWAWAQSHYDLQLETVFFGGGTPSALSLSQLETLFGEWSLHGMTEVTMEANPMTISEAKAGLLKKIGFNRISLGVQAFDDDSLKLLGRTHHGEDVRQSVRLLREAGFHNLNMDLMFALPGQTAGQWKASLEAALELHPEHLSAYNLNYEEDTDFFRKWETGKFQINENQERDFFLSASDLLKKSGFDHYEISNYARPGFRSLHNQAYWQGADYLGLGPSACSTVGQQRWKNVPDTMAYAKALLETGEPSREYENLDHEMKKNERILLGLRTSYGIDPEWVHNKQTQVLSLMSGGFLEQREGRLCLTPEGQLVSDSVTTLLI
jgi:oxygen-independent coproporphyrinogen III oxidase